MCAPRPCFSRLLSANDWTWQGCQCWPFLPGMGLSDGGALAPPLISLRLWSDMLSTQSFLPALSPQATDRPAPQPEALPPPAPAPSILHQCPQGLDVCSLEDPKRHTLLQCRLPKGRGMPASFSAVPLEPGTHQVPKTCSG